MIGLRRLYHATFGAHDTRYERDAKQRLTLRCDCGYSELVAACGYAEITESRTKPATVLAFKTRQAK